MAELPTLVWFARSGVNEELRYSIRSITANLPHENVLVVGYPPSWYTGRVLHPVPIGTKHQRTTQAMRQTLPSELVSDPFVYINDDFFLFGKAKKAPVHAKRRLAESVEIYRRENYDSVWARSAADTLALLRAEGFEDPWDLEVHTPLLVLKDPMRQALQLIKDKAKFPAPYKRTIYGAFADVKPTIIKDPKIQKRTLKPPSGKWLSTSDKSFRGLAGDKVRAAFPDPSGYEV